MKTYIKNIFANAILISTMALGSLNTIYAQDKESAVKNMVESQNFVFKAQTANPMSGRTRQLTSEYDLKVLKDSIIAYLPYFGRAYSPPVNPSEGGIQFTSTQFEYKKTNRKKGGWDIQIIPKDGKDVRQLDLRISENGSASLVVSSNNRQSISFNGYIEESSIR
jgi:uncharacterized protein DUF4251